MAVPCRIRAGSTADTEAVRAIERTAFTDPWSRAALAASLAAPSFVAELGGRVIGYVFFRALGDEGEILNFAVHPEARGAGVARALMGAALGALRQDGVRRVFLEVRESNEPARRFYRAQGFQEVGRRARYYRNPAEAAVVLGCEIGSPGGPAKNG